MMCFRRCVITAADCFIPACIVLRGCLCSPHCILRPLRAGLRWRVLAHSLSCDLTTANYRESEVLKSLARYYAGSSARLLLSLVCLCVPVIPVRISFLFNPTLHNFSYVVSSHPVSITSAVIAVVTPPETPSSP